MPLVLQLPHHGLRSGQRGARGGPRGPRPCHLQRCGAAARLQRAVGREEGPRGWLLPGPRALRQLPRAAREGRPAVPGRRR
eukprot:14864397-Alexandrium_andersonii.AAC.1